MNRNRKLIASLVGIVALTNTVMPVCAEPAELTMEKAEDFEFRLNDTENVKETGNINLLDASVGLASDINNMNNNKVAYLIQPGDTLSSIAKANNTTVGELVRDTGITDPNKIKAGDYLVSDKITEAYVLSKGQDPKQTEKQYMKIGVTKRNITNSEREILRGFFNAEEYAKMYPDVAEACKSSLDPFRTFEEKLFDHFINLGIWENRQPSESFSVAAYASAYSDLREAFGDNIVKYYTHYYNTTVNGDENRTITTVQKAQDAGIKVTNFDGNTVAVDAAGNIVTGEEADKIAAEKKLAVQTGPIEAPIPNVTWTFDFDEETEKEEEVQAPSSEEKEDPVAPVAPTKTFAEAYKEWLAEEPVGGSGNVYMVWYEKEPNLADYEDGRAFLALKEAWEKERPDYDAYLATTDYASDYEAWKAKEPKLADYTILIGDQKAQEKYEEDYAAWAAGAPKPEDYIKYTSFEADYNNWFASAPVPNHGKYATYEDAMSAYSEAHTAWETNKPKESEYIDSKTYEEAVGAYIEENPEPAEKDYTSQVSNDKEIEDYKKEHPEPTESDYVEEAEETDEYKKAVADHEADKPNADSYVDDIYADEDAANSAYNDDHSKWEGDEPSKDSYIDGTTYAEDLGAWEDKEPNFNEYFGIEEQNTPVS